VSDVSVVDHPRTAELDDLVRVLVDRVAARLVEAIELDDHERDIGGTTGRHTGVVPLADDPRNQQLLVGAWLSEELAVVNQDGCAVGPPARRRPIASSAPRSSPS
jgi:hypothetical protein